MTDSQETIFDWVNNNVASYLNRSPGCQATPFELAVQHALIDLGKTASVPGTYEEHRTSVFMGLLGAQLSWYATLAKMSGVPVPVSCLWGQQKRKEEARSGVDFGMALQLGSDKYHLAFFQAKRATADDKSTADEPIETINVSQPPSDNAESTLSQANAFLQKMFALKDQEFPFRDDHWTDFEPTKHHQFTKLLRLCNHMRCLSKSSFEEKTTSSGVHYVIWRDKNRCQLTLPFETAFNEIRSSQNGNRLQLPPITIHSQNTLPFADLLIDGQQDSPNHWLIANKETALEITAAWSTIGAAWYEIDDGSGSGLSSERTALNQQTTWDREFVVMPPLVKPMSGLVNRNKF